MKAASENTGEKQAGRFRAGTSGNPSGRPRGARNKATLAVQALLDGEAEAITRTVIEAAKAGDATAMRLVLERILPPRREMPVTLSLPLIKTPAHIVQVQAAVMAAVARGDITPGEGTALCGIAEQVRRAVETAELETRLATLEERMEDKNAK
jgi:hypothetical protein